MFKKIEKKKKQIDEKRPLSKYTVNNIREELLLQWIYNSNAIEGNTLTIRETKVVLEDGITVGGKTLKEHLEVVNHKEAILYIEDTANKKELLSEKQIKNINYLILKSIDDEKAGVYRNRKVIISGASHSPPLPYQIKSKMEGLINWYRNEGPTFHTIERAAKLHTNFVNIHPFIDGNGRIARLLLNFELMKDDYPPAIIRADDRGDYYDALDKAATIGDYGDFIKMVRDAVEISFDLYLYLI